MRAPFTEASARQTIRDRVAALASRRGMDSTELKDSEVLPDTGLLDSAGILELILWFETTFDVSVDQADLTLDNFGTIDAMINYLRRP
jgi:D-alanine--poly(phosphoribitol) ligase subunit 2